MLSTRLISSSVLLLAVFTQCQDVPPTASRFVYVSADQNDVSRRVSNDCAFRYTIVNTFARLDDNGQREAIRAGFALWQQVDPNVGFLEFSATDRAELLVRFVAPEAMPAQSVTAPVGLLRGPVAIASALRRESNGRYTILLNNTFDWTRNALVKAIAYQAGSFLGLATSTETNSLMFPFFGSQSATATEADSVLVNRLFASACRDLTASALPLSLAVSGPLTKTIKFDRQGTIFIKASGQINVGAFVGISPPEGLLTGVLGLSLASYSIEPDMSHAALMYKLNTETAWHYCGKGCSFPTNGNQYVDLTFNINDNNYTDNSGAYNVVVDYQ